MGDKFDEETVLAFSEQHLKNFVLKKSMYILSKAKRLGSVTNQSTTPLVTLLFLLKKDDTGRAINKDAVLKMYTTSEIPYYLEPSKNSEAKYRLHPSELRMEFYIDILQSFGCAGENVIGIYAGAKLMIAAKVRFHSPSIFYIQSSLSWNRR